MSTPSAKARIELRMNRNHVDGMSEVQAARVISLHHTGKMPGCYSKKKLNAAINVLRTCNRLPAQALRYPSCANFFASTFPDVKRYATTVGYAHSRTRCCALNCGI